MRRVSQTRKTAGVRRRLIPWLASAVLVLLAAGLRGAPAEPEEEAGPEPAQSERAEPDSEDGEASSAEVFLPTEEISEDYAAPFPVDI